MRKTKRKDRLYLTLDRHCMNTFDTKSLVQTPADPIDDYLECVTYCSISSGAEENDCQTICMERHLKSSYF